MRQSSSRPRAASDRSKRGRATPSTTSAPYSRDDNVMATEEHTNSLPTPKYSATTGELHTFTCDSWSSARHASEELYAFLFAGNGVISSNSETSRQLRRPVIAKRPLLDPPKVVLKTLAQKEAELEALAQELGVALVPVKKLMCQLSHAILARMCARVGVSVYQTLDFTIPNFPLMAMEQTFGSAPITETRRKQVFETSLHASGRLHTWRCRWEWEPLTRSSPKNRSPVVFVVLVQLVQECIKGLAGCTPCVTPSEGSSISAPCWSRKKIFP
ncbi:hypothetical protein AB1Y20_005109 [Prymnesium parvum]|uniref:Uncharacterized protein n=1 Tax=Prymnesium parvum TaxID=97485 RepID=A0AB34J378_PRYPA